MELKREQFYQVKLGDSLDGICKELKVSEKQLVELNQLSDKKIEAGDMLILPASYSKIYIVKPRDNLKSVAISNGVTVEHIKSLNKVGQDIFIGQQLFL